VNIDKSPKPGLISKIYNILNPRPRANQEAQFNAERWNKKILILKTCQCKKNSNKKNKNKI